MDQLILPLKRYAQFDGRANRREYWMFQLFMLIVSVVLMVPMITALVMQSDGLGIASIILFVLFWLATVLPVRRSVSNMPGSMKLIVTPACATSRATPARKAVRPARAPDDRSSPTSWCPARHLR